MATRRQTLRGGMAFGLAAGLWSAPAFATVYMDIEQARKLLLPQAATFQALSLPLDAATLAAIAQSTQSRVPAGFQPPSAWTGLDAQGTRVGYVLADHVIGRYEWIDYAAGFTADGTLTQVEILAYRESHGGEIRNAAWRRQFSGRKGPAQIRFNEEIRNISGATLSCQHVTEGVQRLSALVQQQVQHPVGS